MIELRSDALVFSFPEVHPDAVLRLDFQRTLRIPDDDRDYPLPPGLGRFHLRHVDDFADRVPGSWLRHGGVLLPMYQAEALWVNFTASRRHGSDRPDYPFAVKVATGKVNAVSGEEWRDGHHRRGPGRRAAHRRGIHAGRPPLVRLLRRRPEGAGGVRSPGEAEERAPARDREGGHSPPRERSRGSGADRSPAGRIESAPGAGRLVLNRQRVRESSF